MTQLPQLNLPPAGLRFAEIDSQLNVFDRLRNKYVVLTPEEWVRQNFVEWLLTAKGYPAGYVVNETGLRVNGRLRRADTVVYSRSLVPIAVIEYKQPGIAVTQKVFDQIVRYNMVFRAPVIMVSNGLSHYCCAIDFETHSYAFLREIPTYAELCGCASCRDRGEAT